jgi:putative endonuclease
MKYFYVYVLLSLKDGKFYTGFTRELDRRIEEHNSEMVYSTKYRRPLRLVYFECSMNLKDALHREKYLKTTYGKRYIRNRLKNDLSFSGCDIS